jgi:hypothetical protein
VANNLSAKEKLPSYLFNLALESHRSAHGIKSHFYMFFHIFEQIPWDG